jgi:MoaA/NifB/PqqE/SkfB family radical SAM enzyme
MYLETLEKLDIELTNTCNLKCPYCLKVKPNLRKFVKDFQELDYEVLTSFIIKLKKYKLKEVILMGSI